MKYAVLKVINGSYFIHTEGWTDLSKAKVSYHDVCKTLWNADDVVSASVMIVDENLYQVESYKDFISHPEVIEDMPEPVAESEE